MLDDLIAAYGQRFAVAAIGVALALLCLFVVLWLLRRRSSSPFVRGGRNRQPRLQVLDAAAVDTRRRIVLIRRDNVEHLVMIGGPTDVVIESGIGEERNYISVADLPQTKLAADQPAEVPLSVQSQTARPLAPAQEQETVANLAVEPAIAPTRDAPAQPSQQVVPPKPKVEPLTPASVATVAAAASVAAPVAPNTEPEPTASLASEAAPGEQPTAEPAQVSAPSLPVASVEPSQAAAAKHEETALDTASDEEPKSSAATSTAAEPDEQSVDDILDAARNRVLKQQPATDGEPHADDPQRQAGSPASDFERILEAEMNSHLAASIPPAAPSPQRAYQPTVMPPGPRASAPSIAADPRLRDVRPPAPPVTAPTGNRPAASQGATNKDEPNLQNEIARIFGEMSAKRD